MERRDLVREVRRVLFGELFGVLATRGGSGPHCTIVSFVPADDLRAIVFATPTGTRKYQNLQQDPQVSFFVDNRRNDAGAIPEIYGIEVRGQALELADKSRGEYETLYRARYPDLDAFVQHSALIRIHVNRYDVVHRFQNVYVLDELEGKTGRD